MRKLNAEERDLVGQLTEIPNCEIGLFEVTQVQLDKSIVDANESIRAALQGMGVHNFEQQAQGQQHKQLVPTVVFSRGTWRETTTSLYRPRTKQGDPRLWPRGSRDSFESGEIVAVVVSQETIYFVPLRREEFFEATGVLVEELGYDRSISATAQELLSRLRRLAARGPIPSPRTGDTAIGAAVEAALGIEQNSSKAPDYAGIELKSKRRGAKVRSNLFAQVPDWSISACASSAEILDRFGYERDGLRRLNCTVRASQANSQQLQLTVDHQQGLLHEICTAGPHAGSVASWQLEKLRERAANKHAETFWITARSVVGADGREWFELIHVDHTRSPRTGRIGLLIDDDVITLDHLIKRDRGRVSERGPLFKIDKQNLNRLFPEPLRHELR